MAALPEDFLKKVIAEVAALKNIVDAQKVVKETDATVTACAKIAYTQICKFCRRPFHWGARTEYFDVYTGPTLLRSLPLDRTQPILVIQDGTELKTTEYKIVRNRLILYDDLTDSVGNPRHPNIEFVSTGGIKLIEDNNTLYTAVMMQAVANYHRKDTYGLSETSGEKGVARTPSDSGEIIESVRQLLDELQYNGIGYTLDGE